MKVLIAVLAIGMLSVAAPVPVAEAQWGRAARQIQRDFRRGGRQWQQGARRFDRFDRRAFRGPGFRGRGFVGPGFGRRGVAITPWGIGIRF